MKVGDLVIKIKGDYIFQGVVVSTFEKRNGMVRVVVEHKDGILHIFSPSQLKIVVAPEVNA